MSVVSVLKAVFLFETRVKVHWCQNRSAEQPLQRGLSCKTRCSLVCTSWLVAVEFAPPCAVEFVLLCECAVGFAIFLHALKRLDGVLTMHTIVLFWAVEFLIFDSVKLSLETLCSELPCRCAGDAHLSTNERKVQRTWSESSAGQKVQGFRTRGHVNRTTLSTKSTLVFLWVQLEGFQLRALPVVDLHRGGYCGIHLSFISFPDCSRNNTRRSSCQPDNTFRPSTPLPFSLMTGTKTPAKSILDGLPVVHLGEGGCCLLHLSFISSPDCWLISSRSMLYVVPSTIEHCNTVWYNTRRSICQVVLSIWASMWVELVANLYLCYCQNLLRAAGSSILVWLGAVQVEAIQSGN